MFPPWFWFCSFVVDVVHWQECSSYISFSHPAHWRVRLKKRTDFSLSLVLLLQLKGNYCFGDPFFIHFMCLETPLESLSLIRVSSFPLFRGSGWKRPGVCSAGESGQISCHHKPVKRWLAYCEGAKLQWLVANIFNGLWQLKKNRKRHVDRWLDSRSVLKPLRWTFFTILTFYRINLIQSNPKIISRVSKNESNLSCRPLTECVLLSSSSSNIFLDSTSHCCGAGDLFLLSLVYFGPLGLPYLPGCLQPDH